MNNSDKFTSNNAQKMSFRFGLSKPLLVNQETALKMES